MVQARPNLFLSYRGECQGFIPLSLLSRHRRVSWDSTKGGVKDFEWVAWASIELGKCKLGLGPNQLLAQQTFSTSSLGLSTTSPNSFEPGECSKDSEGPCFSTPSVENVR